MPSTKIDPKPQLSKAAILANRSYYQHQIKFLSKQLQGAYKQESNCIDALTRIQEKNINV